MKLDGYYYKIRKLNIMEKISFMRAKNVNVQIKSFIQKYRHVHMHVIKWPLSTRKVYIKRLEIQFKVRIRMGNTLVIVFLFK